MFFFGTKNYISFTPKTSNPVLKKNGTYPCFPATVDGKNPAPVDMVNIPLFSQFYTSQVVQDFLYQQYVFKVVRLCLDFFLASFSAEEGFRANSESW